MLAAKLFETERLTLGQAAELARMSKRSFVEALGRMGVPVFSYPAKELAGEISW
jgi:predicted HTH domain antitoxin